MAEGSRPDQRSDIHVQRSGPHSQLWAGNTSKHHCSACARYKQLEQCECVLMHVNQIYVYTVCDEKNSTQGSHEKVPKCLFVLGITQSSQREAQGRQEAGLESGYRNSPKASTSCQTDTGSGNNRRPNKTG